MKFVFKGDPNYKRQPEKAEDPRACHVFGLVFPLGEVVDVEDEHAIRKLEGNTHFAKAPGRPKVAKAE